MSSRCRAVLLILVLCSLWASVRLVGSESTMTTDETLWQGRSANFYLAVAKGQYEHTYQMAHPGVPVMLAGGLGVLVTAPSTSPMMGSMCGTWPIPLPALGRLVVIHIASLWPSDSSRSSFRR